MSFFAFSFFFSTCNVFDCCRRLFISICNFRHVEILIMPRLICQQMYTLVEGLQQGPHPRSCPNNRFASIIVRATLSILRELPFSLFSKHRRVYAPSIWQIISPRFSAQSRTKSTVRSTTKSVHAVTVTVARENMSNPPTRKPSSYQIFTRILPTIPKTR